jgi:hypothetical protein
MLLVAALPPLTTPVAHNSRRTYVAGACCDRYNMRKTACSHPEYKIGSKGSPACMAHLLNLIEINETNAAPCPVRAEKRPFPMDKGI